uniref:Uncharacterized protein n=1 Tax=Ananas comosus var. bracteatus TaxID=296719 RepID=A0A6V7QUT9_ANACO
MSTTATTAKPTVVLFPSPGMGHLVSMVELGELLLRTNSLSVTILTLDPPFHTGATATDFVARAAASHPDISFLPLDAPTATTAPSPASSSRTTRPSPSTSSAAPCPPSSPPSAPSPSPPPVRALVLDFFCTDALDAAAALRIPASFFFTSSASALAAFLHLPFLHSHLPSSFKDMGDTPVAFPGHPDIPASHMPSPCSTARTTRTRASYATSSAWSPPKGSSSTPSSGSSRARSAPSGPGSASRAGPCPGLLRRAADARRRR